MIGNIKETFPPKTGMWKKQVLQDPGYVKDIEDTCCMLSAKYSYIGFSSSNYFLLIFYIVEDVKHNITSDNRLH